MLTTQHDYQHTLTGITTKSSTAPRFNREPSMQTLEQDRVELQLLKLIQQHQHVDGWIVLVAPAVKPNKAFWQACQLPLQKILFIHPQQIRNISHTLRHAICSKSCSVVISCVMLSEQEQLDLQALAQDKSTLFYTPLDTANVQH